MFKKILILLLFNSVLSNEFDVSPNDPLPTESLAPIETLDSTETLVLDKQLEAHEGENPAPVDNEESNQELSEESNEESNEESKNEPKVESNEELSILLPDKKDKTAFSLIKDHLTGLPKDVKAFEKKHFEKQINQKHINTRVLLHQTIDAIYNCTPDSVLSVLSMRSEMDNYFVCNQVLELSHDTKLNASIKEAITRTIPTIALTSNDSSVQLVFFKGNQIFYSNSRVESGYCMGDRVTITHVSLAKRGSCRSRSGVQQILSEYALLTVSGRCRSTCFGDVNVSISPGLRN